MGMIAASEAAHAVCTLSTTPIVFGTYDVLNPAPQDTSGNLVYRCGRRDRDIRISFDRGGAPSFAARRMVNGSNRLFYNLFLDPARTVVWGDGTGGTGVYFIRNPPNNRDIIVPIYGRIPALQDINVGTYTNTIIVTLDF
jgi:spore coat protein U-like protein